MSNAAIKYNDTAVTSQDDLQADVMGKLVERHGQALKHSLNTQELIDAETTRRNRGFVPGVSGNPAGRPTGSRNKLAERFLSDLHDLWTRETENGSVGLEVLERVARSEPAKLLAAMVQVLPKDFQVNVTEDRVSWVINAQPGLSTQEWIDLHGIGRTDTQVLDDTSD